MDVKKCGYDAWSKETNIGHYWKASKSLSQIMSPSATNASISLRYGLTIFNSTQQALSNSPFWRWS